MTPEKALKEAIQIAGSQTALGKHLNISQQAISEWTRCPPRHVLAIETLTNISRHDLRPDIFGKHA